MTTLVGPGALNFSGLIAWFDRITSTTTFNPDWDGRKVLNCFLHYLPDIDSDQEYISSTVETMHSTARKPTPERALIDYMRHLDIFEEFYFVEGLREYVDSHEDLTLLREVAAHYDVTSQLEEWLVEIEDRSDCQ